VGGNEPKPPSATPEAKDQYNFTDPESRIMKVGNGEHFEQSYNAQAAVDTEGSMLVLGAYVTDAANDKQQLKPAVQSEPFNRIGLSSAPEATRRTKKRGTSFFSTGVAAQTSADFKPLFAARRSVNEGVRSSPTGC